MSKNEIARQRCEQLLELAAKNYSADKKLSLRYVTLARKLAMRHRISLGGKKFCKKCGTVFIAGETLKVRLEPKNKRVQWICLQCGAKKSFGYSKKQPAH
ncbi:ribonuclease P [Candidatus Micrarchaeota archaeon]|nr:ribonuclease P [Candidatus Micrarchaeota archaeon]